MPRLVIHYTPKKSVLKCEEMLGTFPSASTLGHSMFMSSRKRLSKDTGAGPQHAPDTGLLFVVWGLGF